LSEDSAFSDFFSDERSDFCSTELEDEEADSDLDFSPSEVLRAASFSPAFSSPLTSAFSPDFASDFSPDLASAFSSVLVSDFSPDLVSVFSPFTSAFSPDFASDFSPACAPSSGQNRAKVCCELKMKLKSGHVITVTSLVPSLVADEDEDEELLCLLSLLEVVLRTYRETGSQHN